MKTYRTIIALLLLAAMIIPQATPVLSAPLSAEKTIDLQPGDTITINCPTRLLKKSFSHTKWKGFCRPGFVRNKGIEAVTATPTQPSVSAPIQYVADMNPLDMLTVTCSTRLMLKSASRARWKLLCRPAKDTATQPPEPTATQSPEPTATKSSDPTATESSAPTATQSSEPTATESPAPTATQPSDSNGNSDIRSNGNRDISTNGNYRHQSQRQLRR